MEIIYAGAHTDVVIEATGQHATNGTPIDVADTIARALLAQDTWTAAKPAKAGGPDGKAADTKTKGDK